MKKVIMRSLHNGKKPFFHLQQATNKNGAAVIIILFLILTLVSGNGISFSKEEQYDKEIDLNSAFDKCLKDVNIEEEVKNYLEIEPVYVNLKECIDVALFYNFYLKSAKYEYLQTQWEYKNALSQFLPDIQSSNYAIYYTGQILVGAALVDQFHELALSVNLSAVHQLTNGGQQIFQALARKNLKYAGRHNMEFTKDEVILYVSQYYYDLLRTKLSIEIYQKNYKERCAQLTLTQNLKEAGLGTKFDVIRSQTELAQAKQNLLDAMQEFRLAQAKLANAMGIEITTALMPVELEAKEYKLVDENETIDDLFEIARATRQDIKRIESEIKALKDQKYEIYTQFVPKPRVFTQQRWQGTATTGLGPATIVGGYLDFNLGKNMGVGTITEARAKQAQIDKRIVDLEQSLRDIKENILKSYYESKVSKDRIKISEEQVDYATESVTLAELRLDAGEGILIDVIQAQTFKTRTRIELITSIIRYNSAQIQMLFDSGIISEEKVLKNYAP